MTTATRAPKRESIAVLATVLYDAEASTPWHELWHARSDSRLNVTLAVRYDVAAQRWACEPERCPGFARWGRCHHCARCARMRRIRFFGALFAGQPPRVLRAEMVRRQERVAAGMADDDDHACLDMIAMRLENIEAA